MTITQPPSQSVTSPAHTVSHAGREDKWALNSTLFLGLLSLQKEHITKYKTKFNQGLAQKNVFSSDVSG